MLIDAPFLQQNQRKMTNLAAKATAQVAEDYDTRMAAEIAQQGGRALTQQQIERTHAPIKSAAMDAWIATTVKKIII